MLTQKEMTAHIRKRIKVAGIKAKVSMKGNTISINVPTYESEFSIDEQKQIKHIAICNKLTSINSFPIDIDRHTNPHSFHFYHN
jgi:uncharacterized protein YxjI